MDARQTIKSCGVSLCVAAITRRGAKCLPVCMMWLCLSAGVLLALAGCYAPLHSYGIPATTLPDTFRTPIRSGAAELNFSALTMSAQADYILGPRDVLEVTVHGLYPGAELRPIRVQVMASGDVQLPVAGPVRVGGLNLLQAQVAITRAYEGGELIRSARVNVYLAEKSTTSVLVLGEVRTPGVYALPKYENDVAHALAMAGGLREDASVEIEVHRRVPQEQLARAAMIEQLRVADPDAALHLSDPAHAPHIASEPIPAGPIAGGTQFYGLGNSSAMRIVHIPMRGMPTEPLFQEDVVLNPGDVVVVPSRTNEVFYVVGRLSPTNFVRFSVGARERDLGAGFVLPRDRDIDVVTAVAMAGYIDPIDSPTTVTVHRTGPDGGPVLILVDLIKARYDRRETILVQAGDIIYLNPDAAWWSRRTFDRIIPSLFSLSYRRLLGLSGQGTD